MWSPQKKKNGTLNPFYEFMREVVPGDFIFSYANGEIAAVGIAQSSGYTCPKPEEFGKIGDVWSPVGWRVEVRYFKLTNRINPSRFASRIVPLLPQKYSPLTQKATGKELYLTRVPDSLAQLLVSLIGEEAKRLVSAIAEVSPETNDAAAGLAEWEDLLVKDIAEDRSLDDSTKRSVVLARRGQGKFRTAVMHFEKGCRLTGVQNQQHLIASHIKPWRVCESYDERLHGENGFLMTPSIDRLFDRGFISFKNSGELLVSPSADRGSLRKMGVETNRRLNVGSFTDGQKQYLDYHRDRVFLQAQIKSLTAN